MACAPSVKFVLTNPYATLPKYQTAGAAGFDFTSIEEVYIEPQQTVRVDIGLKCEVAEGYELQIRSRSSMAGRGTIVTNSPGTVDCDYRGPLSVLLTNTSQYPQMVNIGDRIAQGVVAPAIQATITEIEDNELSTTDRGSGGFGSTGV